MSFFRINLSICKRTFLKQPEGQPAAVAAKIGKTMKSLQTFRNGGSSACHYTTFLAWLTIITSYLGLGNKMVRLGVDFYRRRLLKIRNNRNDFFSSDFSRFWRRSCRTLNHSSNICRFFLRGWAWLTAVKI